MPAACTGKLKNQAEVGNGSRNGSETSIASMKSAKSTITFEKQKVVPRARTMSVQSVLSSFSLRSMLNTREHGGPQSQNCDEEECTNTMHNHNTSNNNNNSNNNSSSIATTFINPTQQIQSPAMASTMVKKRNGVAGKNKQTFLSDLPMTESRSRIGQQLPFNDDKRKSARDLCKQRSSSNTSSNSTANSNSNSNSNLNTANPDSKTRKGSSRGSEDAASDTTTNNTNSNSENESSGDASPIDSSHDSESEEDDISKQNKLTTDALRKLSLLQQSKGAVCKSVQTTPLTSSENLVDPKEPLTQLKFGGKNVILDTTATIRKNSVAMEASGDQNEARKQSLEIISQPTGVTLHGTSHNFNEAKGICSNSTASSNSKRLLQQINEPKKPMYVPAVLRDISETNIKVEDLKSHSPTPSDVTQTTLQAVLSKHSNTSNSNYARSIHSTTSSIVSTYRNKIQSWLCNERDLQLQLIQPTKEHWIPDSKRHSCKYCHKIFTFWERKHHCRHCGDIFCQQHVRHWLYLNPNAKFIIGCGGLGVLSKICDSCLDEYDTLVKAGPAKDQAELQQQQQQPPSTSTSSTSSSHSGSIRENENENSGNHSNTLLNLPKPATGRNIDEALNGTEGSVNQRQHLENIVGSVPADWSWSSF